jgi:hypothetical protein
VELVAEPEAVEPPGQIANPPSERSLEVADDEPLLPARSDDE